MTEDKRMLGYVTAKEIAEKWELSTRRVRILCSEGRIEGAEKVGRDWLIPENAKKPADARITTGAYINWRKGARKDLRDHS